MNSTNHALHVYLTQRNQHAFQRLLESGKSQQSALATSLGKSGKIGSPISSGTLQVDVNAKDQSGRTVLHIACSNVDPASLEYVKLLLAYPTINVNVQDSESHWTPLHRAFYAGNVPACILLLQRSDIDATIKDYDGYTPYDLYNSTIEGTVPNPASRNEGCELYTWGTNRNATLGQGDANDRMNPDKIVLHSKTANARNEAIANRFRPIWFRDVTMAKLHTAALTTEPEGNLRVCGFGSGGRLGASLNTQQYALMPIASAVPCVRRVALGQDHTLALTESGNVFSWGLNRFGQLGYVLENVKSDEPVQITPRKVQGALKKEDVVGVAACKTASACWTRDLLYSWGTNSGQLGYSKTAHPVQILPRIVAAVDAGVVDVALSESAMACLLGNSEVVCFHNNTRVKVLFQNISAITELLSEHRITKIGITKITSCDGVFACLSQTGDVFTFDEPVVIPSESGHVTTKLPIIKPQRVWAVRKKFTGVQDVALGLDGSLILCTTSGHVYVRTRSAKTISGKTFKFQRVSNLQRVIKVCANSSGAYAALVQLFPPRPVAASVDMLGRDLASIEPWFESRSPLPSPSTHSAVSPEDDTPEHHILDQVDMIRHLVEYIKKLMAPQEPHDAGDDKGFQQSADYNIYCGIMIPVHKFILFGRCAALRAMSSHKPLSEGQLSISWNPHDPTPSFKTSGCSAFSVLCLLSYLYTDELIAAWDSRISGLAREFLTELSISPQSIRMELKALARLLRLPHLEEALGSSALLKPVSSLKSNLRSLFDSDSISESTVGELMDTEIEFRDYKLKCHSTVLRARTPYFKDFFDNVVWTQRRRSEKGVVVIGMQHMNWRAARFAFAHVCYGAGTELFEVLDFIESEEELIDFIFEVLAVSNELLLEHLILISTNQLLMHVSPSNVGAILAEASFLQITPLQEALQHYIAVNLEAMLESRVLSDLHPALLREMISAVRGHQQYKSPYSRSSTTLHGLMDKHSNWLQTQDFPAPVLPTRRSFIIQQSPKISPLLATPTRISIGHSLEKASPPESPLTSRLRIDAVDGVFLMDEDQQNDPSSSKPHSKQSSAKKASFSWRPDNSTTPIKSDLKTIMAETESHGDLEASGSNRTLSDGVPRFGFPKGWKDFNKTGSLGGRELASAKSPFPPLGAGTAGSDPLRRMPPNSDSSSTKTARQVGASISGHAAPRTPPTLSNTSHRKMGPTYTPERQAAPSGSQSSRAYQSRDANSAWKQPNHFPTATTTVLSRSPTASSFLAIQEQERVLSSPPQQPKQSIREIQEQEVANRQEEDFLRWWSAEEARIKQVVLSTHDVQTPSKRGNRRGQARRKLREDSGASPSALGSK